MAGVQGIGVEAQAARGAGSVVVHEQVRRGKQAVEAGAAGIGLEIEDDRALVAIDRCEVRAAPIGRVTPPRRPPVARLVTIGRLDLDDVCAEVGEEHRRERAGQHAAGVDHPDSVERRGPIHAWRTLA